MIREQLENLRKAQEKRRLRLPTSGSWPETWHNLDDTVANAISAALLAKRPLLVRGEPGVGKSQLARAAAVALERRFIATVVQPDSEYQDLLWSMDHTQRLADAQLASRTGSSDVVKDKENYIAPGALWWAFDWDSAQAQADKCSSNFCPSVDDHAPEPTVNGVVLLIDEVDKADITLANGLLEALGNRSFAVAPLEATIASNEIAPLVVLTSNDTREMPPALIRRCVVVDLQLPSDPLSYFIDIGRTHYPAMDESVLYKAAEQIKNDRLKCVELPKTGLAEYLDLLLALDEACSDDTQGQLAWLDRIGEYFLKSPAVRQ